YATDINTCQHIQHYYSGYTLGHKASYPTVFTREPLKTGRNIRYNESANTNNIALELFPDVFVARTFAFTAFKLLSFDRAETEDVDMRALLQS
ncbi:MAG: hypothetical protein ACREXW_20720, partial [Gammaproteobacteria bacterium]